MDHDASQHLEITYEGVQNITKKTKLELLSSLSYFTACIGRQAGRSHTLKRFEKLCLKLRYFMF